jgi:hypothetical protein
MSTIRLSHSPVAALATAALAGLVAGAITAHLQGVVSDDWNTVANSGAVWTLVAFGIAAVAARTPTTAAMVGLLALVGEVAGYYAYLADVRHLAATHTSEILWTVAALWIGPLTGAAAFRARWGDAGQRGCALLALAGVIAGEGAYLVRIAGVPTSGWVEVGIACALGAGVLVAPSSAPVRARATALGVGAGVAAAVYVAYRLLAIG